MNGDTSKKVFIRDAEIEWEQVDVGVKRKIMAYEDRLMVVKVAFETGGVGQLHKHPHAQITHIESGIFEIEVDGEKRQLEGGDCYHIPPNILHGAVCLKSGVLIDSFSPMREDFIGK